MHHTLDELEKLTRDAPEGERISIYVINENDAIVVNTNGYKFYRAARADILELIGMARRFAIIEKELTGWDCMSVYDCKNSNMDFDDWCPVCQFKKIATDREIERETRDEK